MLAVFGCSDSHEVLTEKKINTPDGEFTAKEVKVDAYPQKITAIFGDELKRLRSLGSEGPEFVRTYLRDFPSEAQADLQDYDRAFRAWQISASPAHSNEQVIQLIGGYLGNKLVDDFDMEWVTVSDKDGIDYAVRSKSVELMSYPFSTVMKRVEDRQYDFLYGVYYTVKEMLDSDEYMARDSAHAKEQD